MKSELTKQRGVKMNENKLYLIFDNNNEICEFYYNFFSDKVRQEIEIDDVLSMMCKEYNKFSCFIWIVYDVPEYCDYLKFHIKKIDNKWEIFILQNENEYDDVSVFKIRECYLKLKYQS